MKYRIVKHSLYNEYVGNRFYRYSVERKFLGIWWLITECRSFGEARRYIEGTEEQPKSEIVYTK